MTSNNEWISGVNVISCKEERKKIRYGGGKLPRAWHDDEKPHGHQKKGVRLHNSPRKHYFLDTYLNEIGQNSRLEI
jgi:hypothetical protein